MLDQTGLLEFPCVGRAGGVALDTCEDSSTNQAAMRMVARPRFDLSVGEKSSILSHNSTAGVACCDLKATTHNPLSEAQKHRGQLQAANEIIRLIWLVPLVS